MTLRQTVGVFLWSLTAAPVSHYLSLQTGITPFQLFAASVLILCGCLPAFYLIAGGGDGGQGKKGARSNEVAGKSRKSLYFYVFALFAFTAVVDLLIAVTLQQWIPTLSFYLMKGEPYLKTPHGAFINLWDGTFHYLLYLVMVHRIAAGRPYRAIGLVWAGSIMNSMVVLLGGACTGNNSAHVQASFFLNVPYAILPISHAWRTFASAPPVDESSFAAAPTPLKKGHAPKRSIFVATLDALLILGLTWSGVLAFLRVFAALGSELWLAQWYATRLEPYLLSDTKFPLWQMATYAFFFVPFYIKACVDLYCPGRCRQWLADWSAFHLGAALQAQFSYALAAWYKPPGATEDG